MARSEFMKGFWIGAGVLGAVLVVGLASGLLKKAF